LYQDRLGTNIGKACHSLCGAIFLLKNDQFTETGSGQTWESVREKVFSAGACRGIAAASFPIRASPRAQVGNKA
jgi:hypothetical protein